VGQNPDGCQGTFGQYCSLFFFFNVSDIELENPSAVETLRDQIFDSLFQYESAHCGPEVFHRIGHLMLLLPMLTHEVVLARHYWLDVKLSGAVNSNRLLSEMVENTLRECIVDDVKND